MIVDFIFDCFHLLYYKCYEINLNQGRQYNDFFIGLKNKKTTINPANDNDKCFQYTITVTLDYEEIGKYSRRMSVIKLLINKYNWNGINYPLGNNDWKFFE